jgi:hypothetical protein
LVSEDNESYKLVVDEEIEQKAGDYLYKIKEKAQYIKYLIVNKKLKLD